jgi:hypothetical protein
MNTHSRIYSPPPYHLARDIGLNLHSTLGDGALSLPQLLGHLTKRIKRLNSPKAAAQFAEWIHSNAELNFEQVMHYVYAELGETDKNKLIFIKENNLHKMLFFILHYFPAARFVFQVRDPRDYLLSAMERKSGWLGNKFGSNLRAMEIWREDQLGGLNALAHLGTSRVFFQRYEDLVSEPQAVLTALCGFLNLDFESSMLDFHVTDDAVKLSQSTGARGNLSKPLMSSNFGKYKNQLSKPEIVMVETYLGDLIKRFGYELDFPDEKPSLHDIFTPQIYEAFERYVNNEKAPFYSDGLTLTDKSLPLQTDYKIASE